MAGRRKPDRVNGDLTIGFVSDLHTEFHADGGATLLAEIHPAGLDVLVLAGDIAVGEDIGEVLDRACTRFAGSDVVYVLGNHEHYGTSRAVISGILEQARSAHRNLHVLDGDAVEIRGRRFLGGTLWFRDDPASLRYRSWLTDFSAIPDFVPWVFEENERQLAFLERELRAGDVVVTHHLPAHACVSKRFAGSPMNAFFLCDVERLIEERRPALWIHGHTHDSVDVSVSGTPIVCNPFGYARHELNAGFDANRRVCVPPITPSR
jgi:Icc-related predicted phosphoesterase